MELIFFVINSHAIRKKCFNIVNGLFRLPPIRKNSSQYFLANDSLETLPIPVKMIEYVLDSVLTSLVIRMSEPSLDDIYIIFLLICTGNQALKLR